MPFPRLGAQQYGFDQLPPLRYSFFMPGFKQGKKALVDQFVDSKAMRFAPECIRRLWMQEMPMLALRTEGDGNW